MLLTHALVIDDWHHPAPITQRDMRIQDGKIVAIGTSLIPAMGEEVRDLNGALIAPAFVCGHTHLYSVLSRGMPATDPIAPTTFREILEKIWWKLDRALDERSVRASARIGMIEALRCGTVGLIDHHASPTFIEGSLDVIAAEAEALGVRTLLCYETSDRDGVETREAGLRENRRFALKNGQSPWATGLIGGHASFTMDDATLDACATIAEETRTGMHIHVAEGETDRRESLERYGASPVQRLEDRGLLGPKAIFAHCIDLNDEEREMIHHREVRVAHNPSSNLNNRVGFSPSWAWSPHAMLGTDGIGADMYREAKSAWYRGAEADPSCSPGAILGMLQTASQTLYDHLNLAGGRIAIGEAADLQILRYPIPAPLEAGNLGGHFIFGMSASHVESVIAGGRFVLDHGELPGLDVEAEYAEASEAAVALWARMGAH